MQDAVLFVVAAVIVLGAVAVWVRAIAEVAPTPAGFQAGSQGIWLAVLIFVPILGTTVYYALGRPRRR